MDDAFKMSSNRPYLLRALYEWINDNDLTPYVLADATAFGVVVPAMAVKDGKVVLNIAMRAVAHLEMGNDAIRFNARFSGVSQALIIPIDAVIAIYAQETGQGMMLPPEEHGIESELSESDATELSVVPAQDKPKNADSANNLSPPPKGGHLRIVK